MQHLPILEDGELLADLVEPQSDAWLVKNGDGEVQKLVELAMRS